MVSGKNIIKVIEETTIYPSLPAVLCEMVDSGGETYKSKIPTMEFNLITYLKELEAKLSPEESKKLEACIEDYIFESIYNSEIENGFN